ncbi:tetratricopeptide repeat protein [soil metagenome]
MRDLGEPGAADSMASPQGRGIPRASRSSRIAAQAGVALTVVLLVVLSASAVVSAQTDPPPEQAGESFVAQSPAPASPIVAPPLPLPGADTRLRLSAWIERLEADPDDAGALLGLGFDAYQLSRETADPSELARAEEAFARVLVADPENVDALIGMGTLALARHDFTEALSFGEQARALAPGASNVYGVIGDALVELGRYDEAVAAIQTMVDTRPDLSSYSRVSYLRELFGGLDGAIEAMEAAVRAGGPAIENTEYLRVVLGDLWFLAGDLERAQAAYTAAIERSPGYALALVGLGRLAGARGDLDTAITRYEEAAARVPLPEVLVALGEAQEAAGKTVESAATYALVKDIQSLFAANGVQTDLELALFEADHGDAARAVELARAAYAATPNVKAADTLAWALYGTGALEEARGYAEEALRLGSLEPAYHYHAGMIAKAQGDDPMARAWLGESLRRNPSWSPLHAPRAAAALAELGDGPVASPVPTAASG